MVLLNEKTITTYKPTTYKHTTYKPTNKIKTTKQFLHNGNFAEKAADRLFSHCENWKDYEMVFSD